MQPSSAIRVEGDAYLWLREQSAESGVPIAQLINLLVDTAKRRGWRFRASRPAELVEPS